MACTIKFKVGEDIFEVSSLQNIPTDINVDFATLIENIGNMDEYKDWWKNLVSDLDKHLRSHTLINTQSVENYKQAIANTTVGYLLEVYSEVITFPEGVENVKVLQVKSFNGRNNFKRVLSADRKTEIFLIDTSVNSVKKLADYLIIDRLLESDILRKFEENSDEMKLIDAIFARINELKLTKTYSKKLKDIEDRKSLLREYIRNKSMFRDINVTIDGESESIGSLLNSLLPSIKDIYTPRMLWNSRDINNFYNNVNFTHGKMYIQKSRLYTLFASSYFDNATLFNDQMRSPEKSEQVIKFLKKRFGKEYTENYVEDERTGYEIFFDLLFKLEDGFPYEYSRATDSVILFKSTFYQLKSTYGIGFDSILSMRRDYYRGYAIYSTENSYFITPYVELTELTSTHKYSSLEEAKAAIDKIKEDETFGKMYYRNLFLSNLSDSMLVDMPSYMLPGSIIRVRVPKDGIPENVSFLSHPEENIINGNNTKEAFIDLVRQWKAEELFLEDGKLNLLFDNINNIANFLISILKIEGRDLETLREAIELFKNNSEIKFYYVDRVQKTPRGYYKTRLLKLPENPLKISSETKRLRRLNYPQIAFWETLGLHFQKRFGVDLRIMTEDELANTFDNEISLQRAFIKGTTVYINSTIASTKDLFHEYSHIILAYLKTHNRPGYQALLEAVWKKTSSVDRKRIEELYLYDSYLALLEENFVRQFSKYAVNTANTDLTTFFETERSVSKVFSDIFDKEIIPEDLGNLKIGHIFLNFSSELARLLTNKRNMLSDFVNGDKNEFVLSNKKVTLLRNWIKQGLLKEECQ